MCFPDKRKQRLSAGEIVELLSEEGVELSVRTVERVLAEEGFPKLPSRQGGCLLGGGRILPDNPASHRYRYSGKDRPNRLRTEMGMFLIRSS